MNEAKTSGGNCAVSVPTDIVKRMTDTGNVVTVQELNELAARHELSLSLNKSDPGFSLSNDDMRMIAAALRQAASEKAEIARLRADNEDMKRTLDAPIPWLLERDLRAEIERLTAAAREAEFLLTIAVVPDGHERCKMALTALRAALKDTKQ